MFAAIRDAGPVPHHAYGNGMRPVSCIFCIFSSREDLCTAKRLRPDLYKEYRAIEEETGHTLSPNGVPLDVLTSPDAADPGPETEERP